jgi:hypothetical protein
MMRAPQLTLQVQGTAYLSWLVRWAPPRPGGIPRDDLDRPGIRDRLWWGLLKLQMGANDVQLACLIILDVLLAPD